MHITFQESKRLLTHVRVQIIFKVGLKRSGYGQVGVKESDLITFQESKRLLTLSGSKYFSMLDLKSGYWQVCVKESDTMKRQPSLWVIWAFLSATEWLLAFVKHPVLSKD